MADKLTILASLIASSSGSPLTYAYQKPKDTKNCIVYSLVDSVPCRSMDGSLFEKSRIQLVCWGDTMSKSRALVAKMKTLLDLNKTSFNFSYFINDFTIKDIETSLFESFLEFYIW